MNTVTNDKLSLNKTSQLSFYMFRVLAGVSYIWSLLLKCKPRGLNTTVRSWKGRASYPELTVWPCQNQLRIFLPLHVWTNTKNFLSTQCQLTQEAEQHPQGLLTSLQIFTTELLTPCHVCPELTSGTSLFTKFYSLQVRSSLLRGTVGVHILLTVPITREVVHSLKGTPGILPSWVLKSLLSLPELPNHFTFCIHGTPMQTSCWMSPGFNTWNLDHLCSAPIFASSLFPQFNHNESI